MGSRRRHRAAHPPPTPTPTPPPVGLVIIGATNTPGAIDPALLRSASSTPLNKPARPSRSIAVRASSRVAAASNSRAAH